MARSFNGTSDQIAANSAAGYSEQNPYTVAGWVKAIPDAGIRLVYHEARSTSANPFLQIRQPGGSSSKLQIVLRHNANSASQLTVSTLANVFDGTWHHFVYTQDGAGVYALYVDGAPDVSGSYIADATTCNLVNIGFFKSTGAASLFYNGLLAHLAVWHRQISSGEAASLGAGLLPSHLAPDHYWPLFGTDSPEPDIGVAAHVSGTLTGTTAANGPPVGLNLLTLTS